jgi:hypothetical protein
MNSKLAEECRTSRALYQGTASAGPQNTPKKVSGFSPADISSRIPALTEFSTAPQSPVENLCKEISQYVIFT